MAYVEYMCQGVKHSNYIIGQFLSDSEQLDTKIELKMMEGGMAPGMLAGLCDMLKPQDEDSDSDNDQVLSNVLKNA